MKYAILHSQICDNYSRCPAMLVCRASAEKAHREAAIFLDDNRRIAVDKRKCVGCENCTDQCGLFYIVDGVYREYAVRSEWREDPRTRLSMSVERFGCDIIDRNNLIITQDDINSFINRTPDNAVNILEFVVEQTAFCPIQGIEVDSVLDRCSKIGEYKKFIIHNDAGLTNTLSDSFVQELTQRYKVTNFPAIIFIKNGKIDGTPIIGISKVTKESERNAITDRLLEQIQERLRCLGV